MQKKISSGKMMILFWCFGIGTFIPRGRISPQTKLISAQSHSRMVNPAFLPSYLFLSLLLTE